MIIYIIIKKIIKYLFCEFFILNLENLKKDVCYTNYKMQTCRRFHFYYLYKFKKEIIELKIMSNFKIIIF